MLTTHIGTTRFNNTTWEENRLYREENKIEGCIYGLPCRMPAQVRYMEPVIVIEMNIETKKIVGIGKITNVLWRDKYYRIYDETGYNRYIYIGTKRVPREKINNKECMDILENILFKGKGHYCRGHGITRLYPKKLKDDKKKVMTFLTKLFT